MTNTASPIQHASSRHLASEDDDPRQARSELLHLVQQFNALLDNLGSAAFKNIGYNEGEVVALTEGGVLPSSLQPSTDSMPTGTLLDFFLRQPPSGWLEANGQSIDNQSADYKELYLLLFHLATEGESPVANLFSSPQDEQAARQHDAESAWRNGISMKLPDLRGRTRIGAGQGANLSARSLGTITGRDKIILTRSQLPNIHLYIKHPSYTREILSNNDEDEENQQLALQAAEYVRSSNTDDDIPIDNRTEAMGSGTPHNNMQPSIVVLTCIKY